MSQEQMDKIRQDKTRKRRHNKILKKRKKRKKIEETRQALPITRKKYRSRPNNVSQDQTRQNPTIPKRPEEIRQNKTRHNKKKLDGVTDPPCAKLHHLENSTHLKPTSIHCCNFETNNANSKSVWV